MRTVDLPIVDNVYFSLREMKNGGFNIQSVYRENQGDGEYEDFDENHIYINNKEVIGLFEFLLEYIAEKKLVSV